jgi:hypothetical protein
LHFRFLHGKLDLSSGPTFSASSRSGVLQFRNLSQSPAIEARFASLYS